MITLYARAIRSKDKNTLLKVAQDANTYYLNSYKKRYLYFIKNFKTLLYTHHTYQECWLIASNIHGRTFKVSKLTTALSFISLPFLTILNSKEEAFSNLFHYFFCNICPLSDISSKFVKEVLQIPEQYENLSSSLLLSFLEVMNIRLFSSKNKKMNLIEILFQTLVTNYTLSSVSSNFNTIEKIIPNKLLQYIIKRFQITMVSSFISLVCTLGFSNGMRMTFENWLFSVFKIFKTHFSRQIQKISTEIGNNDDNDNDDDNNSETDYNAEVTDCYDIKFNIGYINNINNFIQINHVNSPNNNKNNKDIINNENKNRDIFINIVNNGENKQHLLKLNNLSKMSTLNLIKNAYYYKVNVVIPPRQLQCSICHHLLHKPVESYGYFFCKNCLVKYIKQHENKGPNRLYAKNPITGHFINQQTLYKSPFMNYIVYRYKLFLLDDCVEEYKIEQAKKAAKA